MAPLYAYTRVELPPEHECLQMAKPPNPDLTHRARISILDDVVRYDWRRIIEELILPETGDNNEKKTIQNHSANRWLSLYFSCPFSGTMILDSF